ncbi:uncharacterized protein BHQ10_006198 [Talaromyces amestolkiae]|uniref:Apple domain-containing protein n=1 Tax=Talaromyces amestolkiae TaxID=1196081 RepID=A0A364L312_TALAM|nr:uncharacterized protein BHQ10_006198 [Talaromyces amestolkiae]RAO70186.1 hypothetical protein BHQ10_006198 [Talaromyces amestolkiae]
MLSLLLLGLAALQATARPLGSHSFTERSHPSLSQCANDPVWLLFQESRLQPEASAFCSVYIEATQTQTVTVNPTATQLAFTGAVTVTDATVDVTFTATAEVDQTRTSWYSSMAVIPVTLTSVVEDVISTTDLFSTTDATVVVTIIDTLTTSTTDATAYATVFSTDDITTTDTTVYATQTSTLDVTITATTVTSTATSLVTATATAYLVARDDEVEANDEDDDEEYDSCPAPEPECTSPECIRSSFFNEIRTIAAKELSSACSCLVEPSTTTKTVTRTGSAVVRTAASTIFATATDDITATVTRASSHVVVATTIIDQTSLFSLTTTETVTSPVTELIDVTAVSTTTTTTTTTTDETASATTILVTSVTIDETASATATITNTITIDQTASATVTATQTTTTTVAPTTPTQSCSALSSPYTNSYGQKFTLNCGHYYPIESGGSVGSGTFTHFEQCLDLCSEYPACVGVDYDAASGYCELFNNSHSGSSSGFDSALLIAA